MRPSIKLTYNPAFVITIGCRVCETESIRRGTSANALSVRIQFGLNRACVHMCVGAFIRACTFIGKSYKNYGFIIVNDPHSQKSTYPPICIYVYTRVFVLLF